MHPQGVYAENSQQVVQLVMTTTWAAGDVQIWNSHLIVVNSHLIVVNSHPIDDDNLGCG
jgi:hypothetical protein